MKKFLDVTRMLSGLFLNRYVSDSGANGLRELIVLPGCCSVLLSAGIVHASSPTHYVLLSVNPRLPLIDELL